MCQLYGRDSNEPQASIRPVGSFKCWGLVKPYSTELRERKKSFVYPLKLLECLTLETFSLTMLSKEPLGLLTLSSPFYSFFVAFISF